MSTKSSHRERAVKQMRHAAHNVYGPVIGSIDNQIAQILWALSNGLQHGFDTFHPQAIARLRDLAGSLESKYITHPGK